MDDDKAKLVYMVKKSLDGLSKKGYHRPVILIHGRGMDVSLSTEAAYYLDSFGSFHLHWNCIFFWGWLPSYLCRYEGYEREEQQQKVLQGICELTILPFYSFTA